MAKSDTFVYFLKLLRLLSNSYLIPITHTLIRTSRVVSEENRRLSSGE